MYDYLGQPLSVGDTVVFIRNNYREFRKATITKIHSQKVSLKELGSNNLYPRDTLRFPSECILAEQVIDNEEN